MKFLLSLLAEIQERLTRVQAALDETPSADHWLQAVKEHCPDAPLARIHKRALVLEKSDV